MFKKKKSIHLAYELQGYIQFLCYTLERQEKAQKDRVILLCREICGRDWKILYEVLTNKNKNLERIARDNFYPERRLSYLRACFFETYAKRYLKK